MKPTRMARGGTRIVLLAASVFLARSPAAAASSLSIPAISGAPGGSVVIPVQFAPDESACSGIQFDLQYDSSVMSFSATAGHATRISEKNLYVSDLALGRKRFVIIGMNQNAIQRGAVVNLFVGLHPDAPEGSYALTLSNIASTDPYGRPGLVNASGGTLNVQSGADSARLRPEGILNAASLLPGPIAPGEIVALLGWGIGPTPSQASSLPAPERLGGTAVLVGETAASLLYAAGDQINAVLPAQASGSSQIQIRVLRDDQTLADLAAPSADSAPGIFTLGATGAGPAVVLNADSTLNSPDNPATKGSVVTVLGTGSGTASSPATASAAAVRIGGLQAEVLSMNVVSPGIVQVSCIVPTAAPTGLAVPVVLTIGGSSSNSQAGVTLAIRPEDSSSSTTQPAPPDQPIACDLNGDGKVTPADADLTAAMALQFLPCTIDLDQSGACTVLSVQRVVNAALGGACATGTAPNPHGISLSWTGSNSETVVGYNVYRSSKSEGPYRTVNNSILTATTYTDIGVEPGQTYFYVVTSIDKRNAESGFSSAATVTVPTP